MPNETVTPQGARRQHVWLVLAALALIASCAPPQAAPGLSRGALSYIHDGRTGLCFASLWHKYGYGAGLGLVQVDCSGAVRELATVIE